MRWVFARNGEKLLDLTIHADDKTYRYDARVFVLDGARYLDLHAQDRSLGSIPAHHLFRLGEVGAEMKLETLNLDWMQKWLRANPKSLGHVRVADVEHRSDREKDDFVLTAETAASQQFMRVHGGDAEFWLDRTVFKRE